MRWVADLRDPLVGNANRRFQSVAARIKEQGHKGVARLVARSADAIIAVTPTIADEMLRLGARAPVQIIPNGADFDDFAGLSYEPVDRFRITHAGSFFGARDPRPFLTAHAAADDDIVARFVGDFRASDRAWLRRLGLQGDWCSRAAQARLWRRATSMESAKRSPLSSNAGAGGELADPVLPEAFREQISRQRQIAAFAELLSAIADGHSPRGPRRAAEAD